MKVVYIAGSGRSGSTLLTRILGQLDGVVTPGELRHFWRTGAPLLVPDQLCSCGRTYPECTLWSNVVGEVFPDLDEASLDSYRALARQVDRTRFLPWMLGWAPSPQGFKENLARYQEIVRRLYGSILEHSGAEVLIDPSKDASTLYLLSTLPDVDLTVVHLVRDVRGVTYSWRKRKRRPEFVDREVYMQRQSVAKVVRHWLYGNVLAESSRRRVSGYRFLRYEDFVRSPVESVAQICETIGLESQRLDFLSDQSCRLGRESHIISGNPTRFSGADIHFRVDEDWRSLMEPGDRRLATLMGLPLLLRYGYGVARPSSSSSP